MTQTDAIQHAETLMSADDRVSGDSRKWKTYTVEPNAAIKSALEFCNLCQYLDLIVKYTRNSKNVFLSMDRCDLKEIGIDVEDHCREIEEAIQLIGGKRLKRTPVSLNDLEAIQIVKNVKENLENIDLGMYLYMDELISKRPSNYFVSETSRNTAAHDALQFIRTTKHVYSNLVQHLHEREIVSAKEYQVIMDSLKKSPVSKSKRKKILVLTLSIGSAVAVSYFLFSKSLR